MQIISAYMIKMVAESEDERKTKAKGITNALSSARNGDFIPFANNTFIYIGENVPFRYGEGGVLQLSLSDKTSEAELRELGVDYQLINGSLTVYIESQSGRGLDTCLCEVERRNMTGLQTIIQYYPYSCHYSPDPTGSYILWKEDNEGYFGAVDKALPFLSNIPIFSSMEMADMYSELVRGYWSTSDEEDLKKVYDYLIENME